MRTPPTARVSRSNAQRGRNCLRLAFAAVIATAAVSILPGCGGVDNGGTSAPSTAMPGNNAAPSPRASRTPTTKPSAAKLKPTAAPRAVAKTPTKIVFVNVGQGDAIVIKSGSWTGLIDGGPTGSEGAIEAALRKLGVSRLSAVVVSHPHADHTGGLSGVVYDYRPKQAYVGEGAGGASAALRGVGASITKVRRGATLRFCALRAKVLSPGSLSGDANEDSVVLLLDVGGRRFLFTGDCTGGNESLVGSICARGPPLYLLKVAHHGSRYSTGLGFLSETRPKFAVICVGPNSYGHPTPETIAALKSEGTRIYSTQKNGTVTLTVSGSGAVTWAFAKSSKPVIKAGSSAGGSSGGGSSANSGSTGVSTKVYVTETGECYHLSGCRYLSHSKIPISLKVAKAQGYRACSVCDPPQ